jgi:hypothetical protein
MRLSISLCIDNRETRQIAHIGIASLGKVVVEVVLSLSRNFFDTSSFFERLLISISILSISLIFSCLVFLASLLDFFLSLILIPVF